MRVLVACEFSGVVRDAFASRGHDAWSCDLLETEKTGRHIVGDALEVASRSGWDLMIAHPPCTYLAASGARWWSSRGQEQREAIEFVRSLLGMPIRSICVENPVGCLTKAIRPPNQYIQPWEHGHGETKKTGLWLKGLPDLLPSRMVGGRIPRTHSEAPGPDRWKRRSRTLPGIARAMADQWGSDL